MTICIQNVSWLVQKMYFILLPQFEGTRQCWKDRDRIGIGEYLQGLISFHLIFSLNYEHLERKQSISDNKSQGSSKIHIVLNNEKCERKEGVLD